MWKTSVIEEGDEVECPSAKTTDDQSTKDKEEDTKVFGREVDLGVDVNVGEVHDRIKGLDENIENGSGGMLRGKYREGGRSLRIKRVLANLAVVWPAGMDRTYPVLKENRRV